jgi:hypothetical protein
MKNVNELIAADTARRLFDVSGKGLSVAVASTGLMMEHVDFAGRVIAGRNFTSDNGGDPDNAADGNGIATAVTGVIAANGDHVGLAPAANIVPLKVMLDNGGGNFAWVTQALQWLLDNHQRLGISVVCLDLGDGSNRANDDGLDDDPVASLIGRLAGDRVAVVAPAGNSFVQYKGQQGMSYPAIVRQCISVAAVFAAAEGEYRAGGGATAYSTRPGQITPYSQRLHFSVGQEACTDIFAPGGSITSSGIRGPHGETRQHGTSLACGVTAGVILLMQELHQRVTGQLPEVADVVRWLRQGSVSIYDGDDEDDNVENTHLTYPLVDAFMALYQVRRALQPQLHQL